MKAFNLIKDNIDKQLVLVGKFTNPYISKIQNYILENNLMNRVTLKDYVSQKELDEIISNTAILINPSKVEGFGLQIIEALQKKFHVLFQIFLYLKKFLKMHVFILTLLTNKAWLIKLCL